MTTPSASSRPYVTREEAALLFDGTTEHVYQGDIYQTLELMVPRPGGRWDSVLTNALVISHDLEFTKIAHTVDKPLLVAPLRALSTFVERDAIVAGQARALWALPERDPLDDAYAVDFRLIQPMAVVDLRDVQPWACLGPGLKEVLRARLAQFLLSASPRE